MKFRNVLVARRCYSISAPSKLPSATSPAKLRTLVEQHASTQPRPLNLHTFLSFARPVTPESVLDSGSYTLTEMPRRLAHRVRNLEALPFIVGTNPYIGNMLSSYRSSFEWLATYPPLKTLDDNKIFVVELEEMVRRHANDIPTLAKGFLECAKYMSPTQVSTFLDGAIKSRISVRLIAEQHIAVSHSLQEGNSSQPSGYVGVVDTLCSPAGMIQSCGSFVTELCEATLGASPKIEINGNVNATFPYVPVHLEYTLTELLKNAFRASVEKHLKSGGSIPPVVITLAVPPKRPAGKDNFLMIRIRDQGGGVSPSNMSRIFSYAFTTAGRDKSDHDEIEGGPYAAQHVGGSAALSGGSTGGGLFGDITAKGLQTGLGTIAGLGYGLPMSKLYAEYFGGSLGLSSLEGWGTDVFLKLRCLEEVNGTTI